MTNFLIYAACCIVFETVYVLFAWKGIKKKLASGELQMFLNMILKGQKFQDFKKKVWNWYTIPFLAILWCVLCLALAPITLLFKLKMALARKRKAPDVADQKAIEFMHKYHKTAMDLRDVIKPVENFEQPKIAPPGFGIEGPQHPSRNGQRPENEKQ